MRFADTSLGAYAVKMIFGTLKAVQQREPSISTKYLFPHAISDAIASYHLEAFKELVHAVGVGSLAVAGQPRDMEALEGKWLSVEAKKETLGYWSLSRCPEPLPLRSLELPV